MIASVHPLADEWTDEYALFVVEHDWVTYSRPLRHFLSDCRASALRPVILTGPNVTLTPHLYASMTESGAFWAFRDANAVYDARSGRAIAAISDLWTGATGDLHPPLNDEDRLVPALFFDIYAGDHANASTVIGPLADHAVTALGGNALQRYGQDEPLTATWDHAALTALAQRQMPATERILGSSDDNSWAAMTVARTRDGLLERVRGGVSLTRLMDVPSADLRDLAMPAVTDMLSGLVDHFRPRVAMVSAGMLRHPEAGDGYRVGAQPVDAPLAVLIGPRAVRDLNLDFGELSRRHDITVLGPGRVPSALLRLTGRDPLWAQLQAFAFDLEQERLAAALGLELQEWS